MSQIYDRMLKVYSEQCPSKSTIYNWVNQFKRGRKSVLDLKHPGPQKTVSTEENILKLEKLVMSNRRFKLYELAEHLGIQKSAIYSMLTEDLGMRKVSARWVPKLLSPGQKQNRVDVCNENLDLLNEKWNLLHTLVTRDDTWVYYYDPETKQQSSQWEHRGSPPPVKAKVQKSDKKLMMTVFWDSKGPLLIKFLERITTINGAAYAETLKELRDAVEEKRGVKGRNWVHLLHDDASPRTSLVARTAADENRFRWLSHTPYSPDLAPSDYYLFRKLKTEIKGKRFSTDDEIKSNIFEYFRPLVYEFTMRPILNGLS